MVGAHDQPHNLASPLEQQRTNIHIHILTTPGSCTRVTPSSTPTKALSGATASGSKRSRPSTFTSREARSYPIDRPQPGRSEEPQSWSTTQSQQNRLCVPAEEGRWSVSSRQIIQLNEHSAAPSFGRQAQNPLSSARMDNVGTSFGCMSLDPTLSDQGRQLYNFSHRQTASDSAVIFAGYSAQTLPLEDNRGDPTYSNSFARSHKATSSTSARRPRKASYSPWPKIEKLPERAITPTPGSPASYFRSAQLDHLTPTTTHDRADLKCSMDDPTNSQSSSSVSGNWKKRQSVETSSQSKIKDGKGRWLSQVKNWVSVSEPSTQALKQHKKETYKRAGIALDDPRANVKLHVTTSCLPAEAIRPAGRGPEPEEVARRRVEERRKQRELKRASVGTSHGSTSSHERHSSTE